MSNILSPNFCFSSKEEELALLNRVGTILQTQDVYNETTKTGVSADIDDLQNISSSFSNRELQRISNYNFYDHLDENYSVCSTCLDMFADDALQIDFFKSKPFWIESDDESVIRLGEHLLYDVLGLDEIEKSWITIRDYCKYGDSFDEIIFDRVRGIVNTASLPVQTMSVKANNRLEVIGYEQNFSYVNTMMNSQGERVNFKPWQIGHLKIPGKSRNTIYGKSVLAGAVRSLKMLEAAETAMLLQRITRVPDSYLYKIPIDGVSNNDVGKHIRQVSKTLKRKRFLDTKNGEFQSVLNAIGTTRDYYVPERDGNSVSVEALPQPNTQQHIDDVEYLDKKSAESLGLPSDYAKYNDTGGSKRLSLTSVDVRWSRRIRRVQSIYRDYLFRLVNDHLFYLLRKPIPNFSVMFSNVSFLEEQIQLESLEIKASVAGALREYFPVEEILKQIFKLSDEETKKYISEKEQETINQAKTNSVAEGEAARIQNKYYSPNEETTSLESLSDSDKIKLFKDTCGNNIKLQESVNAFSRLLNQLRKHKKNG